MRSHCFFPGLLFPSICYCAYLVCKDKPLYKLRQLSADSNGFGLRRGCASSQLDHSFSGLDGRQRCCLSQSLASCPPSLWSAAQELANGVAASVRSMRLSPSSEHPHANFKHDADSSTTVEDSIREGLRALCKIKQELASAGSRPVSRDNP